MNYIEMIKDALEYVEKNLERELSLDQLAQRYYMSQTHFYRIFRAVTNKTLKSYVLERRLSESAERIKATDQKILDIALEHGFNSHEAFTRSFQRHFGIRPTEYRKNHISLNLTHQIKIVERDFRNKNNDIIVEFEYREQEELIVYGKTVRFHPEKSEELEKCTSDIVSFVEEYITNKGPDRLYSVTSSDCRDPGKINYFYGVEEKKLNCIGHLERFIIPKSKYAVFCYKGDMGSVFKTVSDDLFRFLSVSDMEFNQVGIDLFEVYEEDFIQTNRFWIWVPII